MFIFTLFLSFFLTIFATLVLSYISIATMIGPWIAPTLVLVGGLALKIFKPKTSAEKIGQEITLMQTVGSVGGIVATAVGFTFPTLYFLDKAKFINLLAHPLQFCGMVAGICLTAGSFGILLARLFATRMMKNPELTFPVSQLVHKTITSQTQHKQMFHMLTGFFSTTVFCFLRDGFSLGRWIKIPKLFSATEWNVLPSLFGKEFTIPFVPIYWSIGFIAGPSITVPLIVGMLSKYFILSPLNNHATYLPFSLFQPMDIQQLSLAFCTGLILVDFLPNIIKFPTDLWKKFSARRATNKTLFSTAKKIIETLIAHPGATLQTIFVLGATMVFFSYYNFSIAAQLVMFALTILATYQICVLSGKIGLAQFGRFTTFVMIPSILLFKLDAIQVTLLCLFAAICAATSTDLLFNYKVGDLCNVTHNRIRNYQFFGLLITALVLGATLWLLFSNLQLGSTELFGQRGLSRALLIQSASFNFIVVGIGLIFGVILKYFSISPSMVFGGIIMPNSLTIGLCMGAIGAALTPALHKKGLIDHECRKDYLPLFSGMFASESLWLIASILAKMV